MDKCYENENKQFARDSGFYYVLRKMSEAFAAYF